MLSYMDAIETTTGLEFIVGQSADNALVSANLERAIHLLIAGATGTGKSALLHGILLNLISHNSTDSLRLVLCDTKMIELSPYDGLPHLLVPVITDVKKMGGALAWASAEIKRRLSAFLKMGVRTFNDYNNRLAGDETLARILIVVDDFSFVIEHWPNAANELQNILLSGRTVGVHLIAVTQTPIWKESKAISMSFRSKVLFSASATATYKTLLGVRKIEPLTALGDILFSNEGKLPIKIRTIVPESRELTMMIAEIISHNSMLYGNSLIQPVEKPFGGESNDYFENDELFPVAVGIVLETGQASASLLQRRLKLGYSRASRLLDIMEQKGYIGPFEGSRPRRILITKEQWKRIT